MDWKQSRKSSWGQLSIFETSAELFHEVEPELCIKFLLVPSLRNFTAIRAKIETCSNSWMREFLELGGLNTLLEVLQGLGDRNQMRFSGAVEQLECIRSLKAVLSSPTGLATLIQNIQLTRSLAEGMKTNFVLFVIREVIFEYTTFGTIKLRAPKRRPAFLRRG